MHVIVPHSSRIHQDACLTSANHPSVCHLSAGLLSPSLGYEFTVGKGYVFHACIPRPSRGLAHCACLKNSLELGCVKTLEVLSLRINMLCSPPRRWWLCCMPTRSLSLACSCVKTEALLHPFPVLGQLRFWWTCHLTFPGTPPFGSLHFSLTYTHPFPQEPGCGFQGTSWKTVQWTRPRELFLSHRENGMGQRAPGSILSALLSEDR